MLESISSVKTEILTPGATSTRGATATTGATSTPGSARSTPAKVHEAARQFEALLLGQILKSMKDAEGGWMGTGEDQTASSAMEYGQEMLAQQLSSNGGLGLANLIVQGLKPEQAG